MTRRLPARLRPPPGALVAALALAALARPGSAGAQEASLSGTVTDDRAAPVEGAAVQLVPPAGAPLGATTDAAGDYVFRGLAAGRYRLSVDRVGFARVQRTLRLLAGEHAVADVRLRADTVVIEGVTVTAEDAADRERARFRNEPGVTARVVSGEQIKTLPGLAEADVLRAVEVMPGVISTSDFSSAFNVRGGSADQNLILLDGFPIYNPFHLGGLFSVFNSDAVRRAELLAGGFGAEYGGRVSSVLNVETKDPVGPLRVDGGVSLLAARLQLGAGLASGLARRLGVARGGWLVSARRSYFDQLLRPVTDFPYYLTDFQGSAGVELKGGGRISVVGYGGADVLDLSDFSTGDSTNVLRLRWHWGNRVAGLRFQQPVGRHWVSDSRLGYSSFDDALTFVDFGGVGFSSRIRQTSLHSDWTRDLGGGTALKLGAAVERTRYHNLAEASGTSFLDNGDRGTLGSSYASLRWQPDSLWLAEPGVRVDGWWASGSPRVIVEPRFAVKRFLGPGRDAAVKLAVGRYAQFLHSLRNEELPVSNDTWVLAGRSTPAVLSDQVQLGLERYWGGTWSASVEAYARTFRGVTEINLADDPNDPTDDLLSGRGRAYGLDLLVRRSTGRLTGWTTLSLLRATRTLPDPQAAGWEDVPPETTFPPIYDRRVDLDLVLQYLLPGRIEAGMRLNYGSPLPYTRPVAQYFAWSYDLEAGRWKPQEQLGSGDPLYVLLGRRNAERYPPYARLDATLRRTYHPAWGTWTPYLQVLNLTNRKNVLWYFYNYDRVPPTRSGLSMFPVLPAVGVEFSLP